MLIEINNFRSFITSNKNLNPSFLTHNLRIHHIHKAHKTLQIYTRRIFSIFIKIELSIKRLSKQFQTNWRKKRSLKKLSTFSSSNHIQPIYQRNPLFTIYIQVVNRDLAYKEGFSLFTMYHYYEYDGFLVLLYVREEEHFIVCLFYFLF